MMVLAIILLISAARRCLAVLSGKTPLLAAPAEGYIS